MSLSKNINPSLVLVQPRKTRPYLTERLLMGSKESNQTKTGIILLRNLLKTGFIRVREMSGKFKIFQGQGIVREFYVVSVKNGYLLKCQGNVREFYNFQFVSNDEKQKTARAVSLTFLIQAKSIR